MVFILLGAAAFLLPLKEAFLSGLISPHSVGQVRVQVLKNTSLKSSTKKIFPLHVSVVTYRNGRLNYVSISFHIEWDLILVTVFLSMDDSLTHQPLRLSSFCRTSRQTASWALDMIGNIVFVLFKIVLKKIVFFKKQHFYNKIVFFCSKQYYSIIQYYYLLLCRVFSFFVSFVS